MEIIALVGAISALVVARYRDVWTSMLPLLVTVLAVAHSPQRSRTEGASVIALCVACTMVGIAARHASLRRPAPDRAD